MSDVIRSIDPGTQNLGLCDFCPTENRIVRWNIIAAPSIEPLFAAMDARPFDGHVIIERQSKKSMKMLSVMHFLQAYYVLKGNPVTVFAPIHKLAGSGQENSGRSNYRARKKAAVTITRDWLRDNPQAPEIHDFFETTKKKDDASDCLLQILAFLRRPGAQFTSDARISEPQKIVCRAPNIRQERTGRYSQSNLKHIISKDWKCDSTTALVQNLVVHKKVAKAIQQQFKTVDACWRSLFPSVSD